jgi:hypothetical protein
VQVILAANDMPSINDVTYPELVEIINEVRRTRVVNNLSQGSDF